MKIGLCSATVAAALVLGTAGPAEAAQTAAAEAPAAHDPESYAAARDAFAAELANMTDGVWMTSNADYLDEDGGIQTYGLALELAPGGLAAVGCLWGETDGEVVGVFWQFFQAWDPVVGRGMVYQSSPSGAILIGHVDPEPGEGPELVQVMVSPDGSRVEVAHRERWSDADTRVGGSLERENGEWVTRRTYTWERERARVAPC